MKFAQPNPRQLMRENVEAQIRKLIARNNFRRGDQLPTYRELCTRFDASLVTVERAVHELARHGVLQVVHGKGCFVASEIADSARELHRIGLVYHGSRHGMLLLPYAVQIMRGLLLKADPWHADLTIFSVQAAQGNLPARLVTEVVDGVIVLGNQTDEYLGEFVRERIPMVVVDHVSPAFALDYVACDNVRAAATIAEHLRTLGHRRITYVQAGEETDWDARERHQAFVADAAQRGLSVRIIDLDDVPDMLRTVSANAAAAPTAIVVKDTFMGTKILQQLDAAGISVPGQVSVAAIVGADGDEHTGHHAITRCRADFLQMGKTAAQLLLARCQSRRVVGRKIHRIPIALSQGTTTGAPGVKSRS